MRFVLLTSKPDSPYADTSTSYEYPSRYRQFFAPLETGEPMIAILYGPDGKGGRGMAYLGWAALHEPPEKSSRPNDRGEVRWEVRYVDRIQDFVTPVPARYLGESMERWVREASASPDHRGRSVRWLDEDDAARILELGHARPLGYLSEYPLATPGIGETLVAERTRRLVEAVARDARFRRDVMAAYEFRCAITGLQIGSLPKGRATSLLEAAHIRPVGDRGPDLVTNGISMTPTVHRLFDEGFLTVSWSGSQLEVVRSPHLESRMLESVARGTTIRVESGMPLLLPSARASWPNLDQIRYHQDHVFKGA